MGNFLRWIGNVLLSCDKFSGWFGGSYGGCGWSCCGVGLWLLGIVKCLS